MLGELIVEKDSTNSYRCVINNKVYDSKNLGIILRKFKPECIRWKKLK